MTTRRKLRSLAAGLLALAPAAPAAARLPGRPAVLVQDFRNRSYEIQYDWVGTGLAYLVRRNLAAVPGIEMLEDRKAKVEEVEPIADYVIEGEIRLDDADGRGDRKFVVFVTLDRTGDATSRRQFLTEGTSAQLFEMAGYLTERIAKHAGVELDESIRTAFGRGMTANLGAFQLFAEAIVDTRIHAKIEAYEKAIAMDPRFAEAHFHMARVHTVLRDYEQAAKDFERTLEIVPDNAAAQNDYAYVLAQKGKVTEAETAYRAAVRLRPEEAKYHLNLGDILRHQGKLEAAAAEYERALGIRPGDPEALAALNIVDAKLGRPARPQPSAPGATRTAALATPATASGAGRPRPTATPAERSASGRPGTTPTPTPAQAAAATPAPRGAAPAATPVPRATAAPTASPRATPAVPPATPTPAAAVATAKAGGHGLPEDSRELENARTAASRARADREQATAAVDGAARLLESGDRSGFYTALGRFYLSQKLNFAAVDALREAVAADPAQAPAHEALADAYEKIGKKADAARERTAAGQGR